MVGRQGRRRYIERIFRGGADRMARRMRGRFVVDRRKLRDFVRYLKDREGAR
jgi:hypothetical protein